VAVRYVLFDLGRVVLDWEPARLYDRIFDDAKKRDHFLENICTMEWHTRHDAGVSFEDNAAELIAKHPDYENEILAWGGAWMEMFDGYIDGTPELMERLSAGGVPLYALTNMPSETKPLMDEHFPILTLFQHIVVSGDIGMVKPDPAIYFHTLKAMGSPPAHQVLFIDDSAKNIDAAAELGLETHLFEGAGGLELKLKALKLI